MDTKLKKYLPGLSVGLLLVLGFWFRWKGIADNHSFWADEAFIAGVAKDLIQGKLSLSEAMKALSYQKLQVLITAFSLKVGGVSELAARLPSVIWGTVGIWLAYLVGKSLSNWGGGLLAGFLYAFSELNLAHSTQAKPYAGLEALLLAMVYVGLNKKVRHRYWWLVSLAVVSTLLHVIGVMSFGLVGGLFWLENRKKLKNKSHWWEVAGILGLAFVIGSKTIINVLLHIPLYNNTTYLRELLWKNYGFVLLPAVFGGAVSYKREKNLLLGLLVWSGLLLGFWNFKSYSHNIRYLMPFFGVMMVFFGVFWAKVGEKFFGDKWGWSAMLVALMLYLGGNKIVRQPLPYYNPNLDLYGDVQDANYKKMYQLLKARFPNYQTLIILNDIPDTERWYLGRFANAYFNTATGKARVFKYGKWQVPVWITKEKLVEEMKQHKQGIVTVEDWQSFMPEEVKEYVKQNLNFEFEVPSLTQVGGSWPLKVYSWGYKK